MQFQNMILCDYCFSRIETEGVCPYCGLNHENYTLEPGVLAPGTNLNGKYIIGRLLGRGGFGATYLAYSSDRKSPVAIKEYFPTGIAARGKDDETVTVFSQDKCEVFKKGASKMYEEAETVFKFNECRNVVSVYEFFYANGTVYFSMEYLEGIDLKNYIFKKGGRLTEQEVIKVVQGICQALIAVHSAGILHRDISPDNMFICTNGIVKLIDFGSAKQVVMEDAKRNYSVVVKQGFAPAEQYTSKGTQGNWTDLYAVGATMYYALTGSIPPDAMSRVDNPDIEFPESFGISPGLVKIIDKCLKIKIDERYQSALELLNDINALGSKDVSVGGKDYINPINNNAPGSSSLKGDNVSFMQMANNANQQKSGYNPMETMYSPVSSQFISQENSQYIEHLVNEKSNGFFKGLMVGLSALVAVLIALNVIVFLTNGNSSQNYSSTHHSQYNQVQGNLPSINN